MTPEEFGKIAAWMGWEKKDVCGVRWVDAAGVVRAVPSMKTSLTDAEAVEAIMCLLDRGYNTNLDSWHNQNGNWHTFVIEKDSEVLAENSAITQTIHGVVEQALLSLIHLEDAQKALAATSGRRQPQDSQRLGP